MSKMKICYINVMDGYSGGEIVLQRLIDGLEKSKFTVLIYTKNSKFVDKLSDSECQVIAFNTQYQLCQKRNVSALLAVIKNFIISGYYIYQIKFIHRADIIHSNSLTSNIYFAIWAKLFHINFIAHSHEIREGIIFKLLHKYIAICSDKIITVSNAVKANWLSHGVKENQVITVYNGVNNDFL